MSTSSIGDVPSTFLAGFRTRLTNDTLLLLWNNRSDTEKTQVRKAASVGAPPASFLPNVNITSLTREAAWLALTDAQRALYADGTAAGAPTGTLLGGNSQTTYKVTGFGSQTATTASTTTALDFTAAKLDETSQTPTTETSVAYRAIWKDNFSTTNALRDNGSAGDTNGGAIFVSIRAGTGTERSTNPYTDDTTTTTDNYDRYEKLVTSLAKTVTDRFGQSQALLGYDVNANGYIDSEAELFGFDTTTPGLTLATANLLSDRLMVLTASGASVKVNQSVFGTDTANGTGYLPYTTAYTALQQDATGKLELVVKSTQGISPPLTTPQVAWAASAPGQLRSGDNLDIVVNFNKDVTVTGTDSTLAIDVGGVSRTASFQSASGSTVTYRYVVDPLDEDTDGITIDANGITLNSSTIRDANGTDADLALVGSTRTQTTILTPAIQSVALTPGYFQETDVLTATVTFNKPITVNTSGGTPTLQLDFDGPPSRSVQATFVSSTATTATFSYAAAAGDLDVTGGVTVPASALSLNGGTIRDATGFDAVLTDTTVASSATFVDTVVPQVNAYDVPAGTYSTAAGDTITFTITFDENVIVTGTDSTIGFDIAGTPLTATYQSSSFNQVTYAYTLAPADPTGALTIGASPLTLNTSTITDAFGNTPAVTTNPAPGPVAGVTIA